MARASLSNGAVLDYVGTVSDEPGALFFGVLSDAHRLFGGSSFDAMSSGHSHEIEVLSSCRCL